VGGSAVVALIGACQGHCDLLAQLHVQNAAGQRLALGQVKFEGCR
jgi:hypothetical protein